MKRYILPKLIFVTTFVAAVVLSPMAAFAAAVELPDVAGTYAVPGRSDLKLRVSVYHAKNNTKPVGGSTPQLTCNLQDPPSNTQNSTTGWKLPLGNWNYKLNTSSAPSLVGSSKLSTITSRAFDAWENNTELTNQVNFVNAGITSISRSQQDGQNIITWGRTSGTALATTYTWYYPSTGVVAENDTVFNNKFKWAWADQNDPLKTNCAYQDYYDAQNILTHELGHWVGIDDDYDASFANNTMYGYGSPTEIKKNTISAGDIAAVNSIY